MFVQYVKRSLGVKLSDELPKAELLARIHYVSDGVVGNVMNLMRYAALLVEKQKATNITLGILSRAFSKRLSKHMRGKSNPFLQSVGIQFTPQPTPPRNQDGALGTKPSRRKARQVSVSDTLTTK